MIPRFTFFEENLPKRIIYHSINPIFWSFRAVCTFNIEFSTAGSRFFFLQTRIAIPRYFSQSYGAYFNYIVHVHVHVHVHTRTVNVCAMLMISYLILKYAPYDWLKYRGMAILVCRKKIRGRVRPWNGQGDCGNVWPPAQAHSVVHKF